MLFNSYEFIFLFLPITLALYYSLGRFSPTAGKALLAAASLVFYSRSEAADLPLMLASILGNWLISRLILDPTQSEQRRSTLLAVAITANIGCLFFFKYADFFSSLLAGNLSAHSNVAAIPLGISFFTFTQIAFLVDARREPAFQHRLLDYVLFVSVFPHLIAGPIIHHRDMMPQFNAPETYRARGDLLAMGLVIFAFGLLKKVLLADTVAPYADVVFAASSPTFLEAWGGALAYTFQIYFDFSGYSDMAVGLGLMLGLQLPINFASPYQARSIVEFWRCWHISLSSFLRDYLYIPLGGSRCGRGRRYANLLITMILGGLWHGANLTFVLWGTIHGLALVINHGWRWGRVRLLSSAPGTIERLFGQALTFAVVVFAWVFFRAPTLADAWVVVRGMVGLNGVVIPETYAGLPGLRTLVSAGFEARYLPAFGGLKQMGLLFGLAVICFAFPNLYQWMGLIPRRAEDTPKARWWDFRLRMAWALPVAVVFFIALLSISVDAPFLYFQF